MAKTLLQLRALVRQRADIEGDDERISDDELDGYINASFAELHDIIEKHHEDYFTTVTAEIVVTTDNTITLPSDYNKTRLVQYKVGNVWVPLDQVPLREMHKFNVNSSSYDGERGYMIIQNALFLLPEESPAGTYRHWYTMRYSPLVDDTDEVSDQQEWHVYGVVDAAIKCMAKDEADVSELMAEKVALLARIKSSSSGRDAGSPKRVVDVRGDDDGDIRRRNPGWRR